MIVCVILCACRNEENALGYHEDVGIAKEDLEDGIDLMDTDNEDAEEEEEDSEEERRVAEGFIEDAKFAENLGLSAQVPLPQSHFCHCPYDPLSSISAASFGFYHPQSLCHALM